MTRKKLTKKRSFYRVILYYAMNCGPDIGFKMKIRIHNEGVVEAVKKSSPPPTPPPAGDMMGSTQIMG